MPKVRTCSIEVSGVKLEANLNVDSKGTFSIQPPGEGQKIIGTEAVKVEGMWEQAAIAFIRRARTERKVIIVRYDSCIRPGGQRNFFNRSRDATLTFQALVALERTVTQGEKLTVTYAPHPDYEGLHSPDQPIPVMMRMCRSDVTFGHHKSDWCIVEWSPEMEDTIVRACKGISAVVDMLESVCTDPEKLMLAAGVLTALPAPKEKPKKDDDE